MAWQEPLIVWTVDHDEYTFTVMVSAAGRVVAHVKCAMNIPAGCAECGALFIDDPNGGPRQKIRALVLLCREALRHASALGITRGGTTLPPRLQKFVETVTGAPTKATNSSNLDRRAQFDVAGALAHAESVIQPSGDIPSLTIADVTL